MSSKLNDSRDEKQLSASWQDEATLVYVITWVASIIAVFISLIGPLAYFGIVYEAQSREGEAAARLHAAFIMQVINSSPQSWQKEVGGLIETELIASRLPEQRLILDDRKRQIATSGPAVNLPHLEKRANLFDANGIVGSVVITRSLQPILAHCVVVFILSTALGILIYLTLRMLPVRALRNLLIALKKEEDRAREKIEKHLKVIFESTIDGIVIFKYDGEIVTCNPAACQLLGQALEYLKARSLLEFLETPTTVKAEDPFPVGKNETTIVRGQSKIPVELTISEIDVLGERQRIAIVRDISERKQTEMRLSYLANYDNLTGLPNRSLFRERLQRAMTKAKHSNKLFALMFLDLDRFKTINDSLGHYVGDELLKLVAAKLGSCLRETDILGHVFDMGSEPLTISRLGGDEFTVLATHLANPDAAAAIAKRILHILSQPFQVGKNELFISASIGITLYPTDDNDLDGLIKQADMAMYRSKELGRGTYYFYNKGLNEEAALRQSIEAELHHALDRGQFRLHYQPKANLSSGQITGVEALIRWERPGYGLIPPDKFIPILEETGLIVPVGMWVIRSACAQIMDWQKCGLPALRLAVNLSARQFRQYDLAQQIGNTLLQTGMPATSLEVELTESTLVDDSEDGLRILAGLSNMGVSVAIDDFGTGHSSLSYLKRFNVHTLKIDRSFVRDTPQDQDDCAIARAVIALGHSLKLQVVAEGVETPEQLDFLRNEGCDEMQGYWLSKPLPPEVFTEWLTQKHSVQA